MMIDKMFYKLIGFFFLGLAVLGAILPLLPTTPFILVAAGCFAKSSPYLHQKLLANRIFGPLIINWQQNRSITLRAKTAALVTMLLSVLWSCFILPSLLLKALVLLLILPPAIFIWRLPLAD